MCTLILIFHEWCFLYLIGIVAKQVVAYNHGITISKKLNWVQLHFIGIKSGYWLVFDIVNCEKVHAVVVLCPV